jgi:hypothetical protein
MSMSSDASSTSRSSAAEPPTKRRFSLAHRSISSLKAIITSIIDRGNDSLSFKEFVDLAEVLSQTYLAFQCGTDAFEPPSKGLLRSTLEGSIKTQSGDIKSSAQLVETLISAHGASLCFDDYADFLHDIFRSFKDDGVLYYNCSSLATIVVAAWLTFVENQPEGSKFQVDDLRVCASLHHVWYMCKDENGATVYLNVAEDAETRKPKVERLTEQFIVKNHFMNCSRYGDISSASESSLSWHQWIGLLVENMLYVINCEVLKYNRTTSSQFDRLNELLKVMQPLQQNLQLVKSTMWLCNLSDCLTLPCFDRCRPLYTESTTTLIETVKAIFPSAKSNRVDLATELILKAQYMSPFNGAAYIRQARIAASFSDPPLQETDVINLMSEFEKRYESVMEESMVSKISIWKLHIRRSQTIAYARLVPLLSASDEAHPALMTFWNSLKASVSELDTIGGEKTSILPDTITKIDLGPDDRGFIAENRHTFGPIFTRFCLFLEKILQKPENSYLNFLLHSAAIVQFQRPKWAMSDPNLIGSCSNIKIRYVSSHTKRFLQFVWLMLIIYQETILCMLDMRPG